MALIGATMSGMSDSPLNPYAEQAPKDLYKALLDDTLTVEQVSQIEGAAFPDGIDGIDFEEDANASKMLARIQQARRGAQEREAAAREAAIVAGRERARAFLTDQMIDPAPLPDAILDEVANSLRLQDEQAGTAEECTDPVVVLARDDETMCMVTESGEVLCFIDAPHAELERRNILEWVGERLARSIAREAGLRAEKQAWLDRINKIYDPQIRKQERVQHGLEWVYGPMAQMYFDDIRAEAAARNSTVPKSLKVGLLNLTYAADRARVDVVDDAKAIAFLEESCPDAVKVTKSVAKSMIPADIKKTLTQENAAQTGIFAYPGGVPKFAMK